MTTIAEMATCRKCMKSIWQGHYLGFRVMAEPNATDLAREVIARIHGRKVFQTVRNGYGFTLKLRTLDDILKSPSETKVLLAHDCSQSPFASHIDFYAQAPKQLHEGEFPF